MHVYRNIAWKSTCSDEENYGKALCLDELEPDEYTLLECISCILWKCEVDLFKFARNNSSFFHDISDERMRDILNELTLEGKVLRKNVYTDLKDSVPSNVDPYFTTSTSDFPGVKRSE